MRSLGLMGLFEYVCALSQNRSNKIYLISFENIQNSMSNPAILWFNNGIQMTMSLSIFKKTSFTEEKISNIQHLGFWVKTFAFLTVRFVNIWSTTITAIPTTSTIVVIIITILIAFPIFIFTWTSTSRRGRRWSITSSAACISNIS